MSETRFYREKLFKSLIVCFCKPHKPDIFRRYTYPSYRACSVSRLELCLRAELQSEPRLRRLPPNPLALAAILSLDCRDRWARKARVNHGVLTSAGTYRGTALRCKLNIALHGNLLLPGMAARINNFQQWTKLSKMPIEESEREIFKSQLQVPRKLIICNVQQVDELEFG